MTGIVSDDDRRFSRYALAMRLLLLFMTLVALPAALSAAEDLGSQAWNFDLPVDGVAVPVCVRAPAHPPATACPVIIFSHGLGGSREGYWPLAEAWAAAGFVVIQPTHAGSDTQTLRDAGLLSFKSAARDALSDPAVLAGRPLLIHRLIDLLPEIARRLDGFSGTLDATRIGVGGHSYGAWTTLAVAGVQYRIPGHPESLVDPRPLAFLAMSPPGPGAGSTTDQWSAATRPLLVMTGTEDHQPGFADPGDGIERDMAWRVQTWSQVPPGDKVLAVLLGAHHCAFSNGQGARLTGEPQPEPWIGPCLAITTTAWWKAWLSNDAPALASIRDGLAVPADDRQKVRWQIR